VSVALGPAARQASGEAAEALAALRAQTTAVRIRVRIIRGNVRLLASSDRRKSIIAR
jgi:hypothetical protein